VITIEIKFSNAIIQLPSAIRFSEVYLAAFPAASRQTGVYALIYGNIGRI
jgi:hypothetical protein